MLPSNVVFIFVLLLKFLLSLINLCNRCGENCGNGKGLPGKDSSLASSQLLLSILPASNNLSKSVFLFFNNISLFFPGCTNAGALGKTASVAISPQLNLSGLL